MTSDRTIAATCPACGDLDLGADQLWLVLSGVPGRDHYAFHCRGCGRLVRRTASPHTVRVLQQMVAVEEIAIPAEALERREAPPLTIDDLIDLMLALDGVPAA